jgi:hypothetical protein
MKKFLLLLSVLFFSVHSFSAPWDVGISHERSVVKAFSDPYVTNYGAYAVTIGGRDYLQLQVSLSNSCPVKWLVTLQVFGVWDSQPGGGSYKSFDVIINSGGWHKTVNFPLSLSETAYTSLVDELYEGPY